MEELITRPDVAAEIPREMQPFPHEVFDRAEIASRRITSCPETYATWLKDLGEPGQFIDLQKAQQEIAGTWRVKKMFKDREDIKELPEALLCLHLPHMSPAQRASMMASPVFTEKIMPLLILFEYRFLGRIPGIVYLLEEAAKTLNPGYEFVGEKQYEGTVIRIDIANFSTTTRKEGPKAVLESLAKKFYPIFFEILMKYPHIKFVKRIGDELILVSTKAKDEDVEAFAIAFAIEAKAVGIGTHTGIAKGPFEITKTSGGEIVVGGETFKIAGEQQKLDKSSGTSTGEIACGIYRNNDKVNLKIEELPKNPDKSAMHFLKDVDEAKREALFTDPEALEEEIRAEMAILASTVTEAVIRAENPDEKRATVLAMSANTKQGENVSQWAAEIRGIAAKYGGVLIHLDLDKGGRKEAIIVFGAQGSTPVFQEERDLRHIIELVNTIPGNDDLKIGSETGEVSMSVTGSEGIVSNAVNLAARLRDESGPAKIRIGPALSEELGKLTKPDPNRRTEMATLKGFEPMEITTCDTLEMATEERGYIREKSVAAIIEAFTRDESPFTHINICGDPGMGQSAIMAATVRTLRSEYGMTAVEAGRFYDKYSTYGVIRQILTTLFPTYDVMEKWMELPPYIDPNQKELWGKLYEELMGTRPVSVLGNTDIAKQELALLLARIDKLVVTYEKEKSVDDTSLEILRVSKARRLTTGSETGEKHILEGMLITEAVDVAISKLGQMADDVDISGLRESLTEYLQNRLPSSAEGKYNLLTVELETDELIRRSVLQKGQITFNQSRLPKRDTRGDAGKFFEDSVNAQIDEVTPSAAKFLKVAVILGDCKQEDLARIAPKNWLTAKNELIDHGIIDKNEGLQFKYPLFPKIARKNQQLALSQDQKDDLEGKMRPPEFPISKYLEACRRMGMGLSGIVTNTTKTHAQRCLDDNHILSTMDACQQFLNMNATMTEKTLEAMGSDQVKDLIEVHLNLIRAKIILGGEGVQKSIESADLFIKGAQTIREEQFSEAAREIPNLKCKAAFRRKQERDALIIAANLDYITDSETNILRTAEYNHLMAGYSNRGLTARRASAKEALKELEKLPNNAEAKKLELQVRGYSIGWLRDPGTTEKERDDYLNELEGMTLDSTEDGMRISSYIVATLRYRNREGDEERATLLAQKLKKDALANGFIDILTTNLNFEMNLRVAAAENLKNAGKPEEAFECLENTSDLYKECMDQTKRRSTEQVAGKIMANILTLYEFTAWQYSIIAANASNTKLRDKLPQLKVKIATIMELAESYERQNPGSMDSWKSDLKTLQSMISTAKEGLRLHHDISGLNDRLDHYVA